MDQIKLSICIPTYNRAPFLEKALGYFVDLYKIPYRYEIVVSDNASTDNTRETVDTFVGKGLPIRYFRRAENHGAEPNLASAFRHARGEYAVYLADDDMLAIDGLLEAIRYLDLNPEISACFAPWYIHNEVEGRDTELFYNVDADVKFDKDAFERLFAFMVERHIFPEIGIYRTATLRSAWLPRHFAYWAFANLAHYMVQGGVAFLKKPFYRQVIQSKIARDRPQAGHDELLTAWDRYRGGLEYFLHVGAKHGAVRLTPDRRQAHDKLIKQFTCVRMAVAMRMWAAKKDYIKAYEIFSRLALAGFEHHPVAQQLKGSLPLMVAVQTLAWSTNAAAEIHRLVLHGVDSHASLEGLLRELGLRQDIAVVSHDPDLSPDEILRTAVFVVAGEDRQSFLAEGYSPNLVFCESDIVSTVVI
ncbi:glycosyltransferase [Sinorhizobium numidicum]|uniref:Glycosyltransferase n=1 Tax=Sinorhizobium numidicum TaxID=680248 RepID=A0ABY8D174_9HYPH|nr:glycosyltransferase family 2 protein [Sinorhizobium numidicum]WEX77991.1 glycosyltransferase [Sinorhizobium numidicum]WEX84650.1 glycosyltransferase [Sinorhizobium numidicum]